MSNILEIIQIIQIHAFEKESGQIILSYELHRENFIISHNYINTKQNKLIVI